jgi:hypothetical protein
MAVAKKTPRHYVNNRQLLNTLIEFRQKRDELKVSRGDKYQEPEIPRYVAEAIMLICNKLAFNRKFVSYTYRDDMVCDGIVNCVAAVNNFDPSRSSNPFAYFTQIAYNAFLHRIRREHTQTYVKHKNAERMWVTMDEIFEEGASADVGRTSATTKGGEGSASGIRHHYDVIEKFETSLARQKEKKAVGVEKFMTGFSRVGTSNKF